MQSRFRRLHLPPYSEEQFLEVSVKVLPKLKIAHVIGKAVWDQGGDIRDVIPIGKLVRKNDGPEEVEQTRKCNSCLSFKPLPEAQIGQSILSIENH